MLDLNRAGDRDRARLRQLQLRREPEYFHRHADALPVASGDRAGSSSRHAGYAVKAATLSGAEAVGLEDKIGALKPGMNADLMSSILTSPRSCRSTAPHGKSCTPRRARGRDRAGRRASRGPQRQARHRGRGDTRRGSGENRAGVPSRRPSAGRPQYGSSRAFLNANREAWKVPLGFER